MKKIHIFTKTVWHCFLGVAEYFGVTFLLAYLSTFFAPIMGENICWQWLERIAFCFTVYEIVLIGIRKMRIDTRVDALLALKTAYERAGLFCETGNKEIYNELSLNIEEVLESDVLNQLDIITSYQNLKNHIRDTNKVAIQYESIKIQHLIETSKLFWQYTLFLRLFKQ